MPTETLLHLFLWDKKKRDGAAVEVRYPIPGRHFLHYPDILPFLCERKTVLENL